MFKIKYPNKNGTKEVSPVSNGAFKSSLDKSSLEKNKDAYRTGLDIANLVTYFWNLQKSPSLLFQQANTPWRDRILIRLIQSF